MTERKVFDPGLPLEFARSELNLDVMQANVALPQSKESRTHRAVHGTIYTPSFHVLKVRAPFIYGFASSSSVSEIVKEGRLVVTDYYSRRCQPNQLSQEESQRQLCCKYLIPDFLLETLMSGMSGNHEILIGFNEGQNGMAFREYHEGPQPNCVPYNLRIAIW